MNRSTNFLRPTFLNVVLLIYWSLIVLNIKECRGAEGITRRPQRLSAFLRNLAPTTTSESPTDVEVTTWRPKSIRSIVEHVTNKPSEANSNSTSKIDQPRRSSVRVRMNSRRGTSLHGTGKILGVDKEYKRKPEELIRTALINHTLEHGGEEDLDKLVFSALPQGSKLVLRTVRIIKTDENGDPADEAEEQQPTYWDVTLANATEKIADDEEDNETSEESNEEEDEEEDAATLATEKRPQVAKLRTPLGMQVSGISPGRRQPVGGNGTALYIRKKPDLLSSGSHSSGNYHNNDYGAVGREKEHGKTHYHGNTHGKTHKQTYTVTDGKDVKPYEGTEKGLTDHAHGHGSDNKDQGERFKSSKRKNKGRKVTGFKRVYHKEEFQRTEHFYDDEEARKIAESFGLSEAKESNDEGTKGDKRKYHGVRTEYLDGKKLENEHGTRDGYDKGQRNTYKDTEKHNQQSNYGKSMSHGSPPQHHHHEDDGGYHNHQSHHGHQHNPHNHHQEQQQHADYHPNHNYHASYSNPQKNTISRLPTSITDKLVGIRAGVNRSPSYATAAIIPAPITTSFTVTEYAPVVYEQAASTPNPMENNVRTFPPEKFTYEFSNFSSPPEEFSQGSEVDYDDGREHFERETRRPSGRRQKIRKEPQEKKIFFSPKHREIKEDVNNGSHQLNEVKYTNAQFQHVPVHALPYHVILPTRSNHNKPEISASTGGHTTPASNEDEDNFPFAPNFSTQQHHLNPQPPSAYGAPGLLTYQSHDNGQTMRRYPKSWRLPRRRHKHPGPSIYPNPTHSSLATLDTPVYPAVNQVRLAAIPVRHANAYHRLGNRLRYRPHRPHILNYVEMSTRKSDVGVGDSTENKNTTDSGVDDAAVRYLNHNHRYAKNHLTSTIHPLASPLVETSTKKAVSGVRNTLLGNTPGGYSTIIKVLPATMINMNRSVATAPVTKRPTSYIDLISITTAYPNLLQQPQQFQPQRLRPFIPRARWLNYNSNYGNNNYGPDSQHQYSHSSGRMPNIMRGIRNSILRPFSRLSSPIMQAQPPLTMVAYPTAITGANGLQSTQLQALPMTRPRIRVNPYYQQLHAQYPVSYGSPLGQYHGGIMSLGSRDYLNTAIPPASFSSSSSSTPASAIVDKKPKFYYILNASASSINDNKLSHTSNDSTTETGSESRFTSPIKVAAIPTLAIASTPTAPLLESKSKLLRRKQLQAEPTPMISGLMDSVSGFFGKVGG